MEQRDYDVVVYGASGYVGRQVVKYLAAPERAPGLRWAIAGRSRGKLEAVKASTAAGADVLVADSGDASTLDTLAARTAVVLNTVGPFARYGDPVVDACVRLRTHYVDITGETPWIRTLIDRYHARASADGTRIVPSCGFDSVPSDLGAYLVARHLQGSGGGCEQVKAFYSMMGGVNGGTLASLMLISENPAQSKMMRDPFLLSPTAPPPSAASSGSRDPQSPHYDTDAKAWVAPFLMGPINTRIVRRSSALFAAWNESYGERFAYQEYMRFGEPFGFAQALAVTAGSTLMTSALEFAAVRRAIEPMLPKPGTGPSEAAMQNGWFRCDLVGRGAASATARATIRDKGDPGNVATTKFVCESALALALERDALPGGSARGGVLTPATALGEVLVRRLRAAGMQLDVE
ncbi:MAG: saccharopine dehydrogenase NADP-binding domain-containing protein [Candidatus Eremiobacteraeota bacterium]|nr:saccharopine dehydrogenase NADP-binding domain-containing protein [Candidatus Eremiobacteraeota bacterium]